MEHVIEGTWEEIKLHEAEFIGRRLKVIVDSDDPDAGQTDIDRRLAALKDFFSHGVEGVIVDDSREGIYGQEPDRG